jgi:hypothetical protein
MHMCSAQKNRVSQICIKLLFKNSFKLRILNVSLL